MSSVVISGDTSGTVTLQAPAVSGSTVLTLPATSGTVVTSTNISTYITPARSGNTTTNLTSGAPTLTLTSSSNQLQFITANASGCSVVMPDATTLTAGHDYFTIYNAGTFPVAIKDNGGTIREYINPISTAISSIKDISTTNGVWEFNNPSILNTTISWNTLTNVASYQNSYIIPVNSTNAVLIYTDSANTTIRCRLLTFNLTTKVITYGTDTAISTVGASLVLRATSGASDGIDRGFISWSTGTSGSAATAGHYYIGFAIVAGVLYLSTVQTGYTQNISFLLFPSVCDAYLGANNAFVSMYATQYFAANVTQTLDYRMFTVTVAGTTVTVTNATGNGTVANTAVTTAAGGTLPRVSRTSNTTFVYDIYNGASVYQSGGYFNCNTSTNTISAGARTSQTTQMVGITCPDNPTYGWAPFVVNAAGTRVINQGYLVSIANVGTATVTTSIPSDITYKPFAGTQYTTLAATYAVVSLGLEFTGGIASYGFGYSVSSSNYIIIDGSNYWSVDPSSATFNINAGYINTTTNPTPASGYVYSLPLSSTQYFVASVLNGSSVGINQYDIPTLATPFKN